MKFIKTISEYKEATFKAILEPKTKDGIIRSDLAREVVIVFYTFTDLNNLDQDGNLIIDLYSDDFQRDNTDHNEAIALKIATEEQAKYTEFIHDACYLERLLDVVKAVRAKKSVTA